MHQLKNALLKAGVIAMMGAAMITTSVAAASETDNTVTKQRDASQDVLTFGIVPQQSASRLAHMWGPLLSELSEVLGVTVEFATTKDIPTFEACLAAGVYDIAYMNPVHYTIFSDASDYDAVIRQADKRLRGLIVVHKDSDVETLDDLAGAEIAFPSPGAFGASVVPRAELRSRDVPFTPNYVKSHDSVYRAVVAGLMPAGGGVLRTFNAIDPGLRDQLRVIYRTNAYTPHAIAIQGRVSPQLRARMQQAFLDINEDRPDLSASVGMTGFVTAADADWDDVRALRLSATDTEISTQESLACPSG